MVDGSKRKPKIEDVSEAPSARLNNPTKLLLVSGIIHCSLTAILVLAAAFFFQTQVATLRRDLIALKNHSVEKESYVKSHKRRDSAEVEDRNTSQKEGIRAVHLMGAISFQHIHKNGKIGPWGAPQEIEFVSLQNRNMEVQILESGLYFIYAQIYYLTSEPNNSFQVLLRNGTGHQNLATCASPAGDPIREVSCYTAFSRRFASGDKFFLNQIEQNRLIHFNNGCSFLGIILLERENG